MKFNEYFERSSSAKIANHILFLTGEDTVMKDIILQDYGTLTGLWDLKEQFHVADVRGVINLWEEGSLMGPRLLDVRVTPKVKRGNLWKDFIEKPSKSDNFMVIRIDSESHGIPEGILRLGSRSVDCTFPKKIKERTKLVTLRMKIKKCLLELELINEVALRVKSMGDVESSIITLALIARTKKKITEKDITDVMGDVETFKSSSSSLLTGNIPRLTQEINSLEPMLLLTSWHSILRRFYCWMSQDAAKKDGLSESHVEEEPEEGDEEESTPDTAGIVKVNKFQLRDYKIAKQRYSQFLVRQIMEDLNSIYQDVRMGKSENWKERVRVIIGKIS